MATRVTNLDTTRILIQQIFDRRISLEKVRESIASGIKVPFASEDPGKSGTILSLQATINRVERHKERIGFATSFLEHQESTLDSADNLLVRARELATQGANGSLSFQDRALVADEVFQLRDQLVALANTKFQGRYVYGGASDDQPPFISTPYLQAPLNTALAANNRYYFNQLPGSDDTRNISITDDNTIRINTPGDQVFEDAIAGMDRLGRALAGYRTSLTGGLPDGNGTAYTLPADYAEQTHDILAAMDSLEDARVNDIIQERSDVGARVSRLEQVTEILDNLKASTETSRSVLQDADLFEASAKFSNLETSLQALLASGAQINNLSLLNYL